MKEEYITPDVELLPIDDVVTASPVYDDDEMTPVNPFDEDWG